MISGKTERKNQTQTNQLPAAVARASLTPNNLRSHHQVQEDNLQVVCCLLQGRHRSTRPISTASLFPREVWGGETIHCNPPPDTRPCRNQFKRVKKAPNTSEIPQEEASPTAPSSPVQKESAWAGFTKQKQRRFHVAPWFGAHQNSATFGVVLKPPFNNPDQDSPQAHTARKNTGRSWLNSNLKNEAN